jgi:glycosyltransferase involved in cell wall biosynthesis
MDALYLGLRDEPLFRFGVCPNKLIDYMMAAKPVIQAINASNDLVQEAQCGYSVPAEDPDALSLAILDLLTASPLARDQLGHNGRVFVEHRHSYSVLADRFLAGLG